jgi:DNA-binding phage protein
MSGATGVSGFWMGRVSIGRPCPAEEFGSIIISRPSLRVTRELRYDQRMARAKTGAESYLAGRLKDPEYKSAYDHARERIDQIDSVIRAFDDRRVELDITKAELARRAGIKPEAIRRLFSTETPNPTLSTLVALAAALDLELVPFPRRKVAASRVPSGGPGIQLRSA